MCQVANITENNDLWASKWRTGLAYQLTTLIYTLLALRFAQESLKCQEKLIQVEWFLKGRDLAFVDF